MPRKPQEPTEKAPGVYPRRLKDGTLVFDLMILAKGKQQLVRGFRGSHKAAKDERARLIQEARDGKRGTAPVRLTYGEYLEKTWLPRHLLALKQKTGREVKDGTRRSLNIRMRRLKNMVGDLRLADITLNDVEEFIVAMDDEGLSQGYQFVLFQQFSASLKAAQRRGLITANPCDLVDDKPRTSRPREPRLSFGQISAVIAAADEVKKGLYGAYVFCTIFTGMRQKELLLLEWDKIDFTTGVVELDEAKTPAGERIIVLSELVLDRLKVHRAEQAQRHYRVAGDRAPLPKLVFTSPRFFQVNTSNYNVAFHEIREKAGLPDLHHHDLRHVFSTLMARARVHPAAMAAVLGHTDPSFSLKQYTHADVEDRRAAVEAVAALFAANKG